MKVKGLRVSYTPLQLPIGAVCLLLPLSTIEGEATSQKGNLFFGITEPQIGDQREPRKKRRRRKVLYVIFVQATNYFYHTSRRFSLSPLYILHVWMGGFSPY